MIQCIIIISNFNFHPEFECSFKFVIPAMILKSRRILPIYYMWTKTKLNATSSVWIKRRKNVFLPESFITWTENLSFFYLCLAMILFTVGFLFQIEKKIIDQTIKTQNLWIFASKIHWKYDVRHNNQMKIIAIPTLIGRFRINVFRVDWASVSGQSVPFCFVIRINSKLFNCLHRYINTK